MQRLFGSMTMSCALALVCAAPARAQYTILGSFNYTNGAAPIGSLIESGSILYGMARSGGINQYGNQYGTVFQIGTNGAIFMPLHTFAGGATDGKYPHPGSGLVQSGSTLYGVTTEGGASDLGTIFRIGTNGAGFSVLHSFAGGTSEGRIPYGSLIQSDSTLYGTLLYGGSEQYGTVFKIGTDGTGFGLLHSFSEDPIDGLNPVGSLVQSGSTLYGVTVSGGNNLSGTIFRLATDGTGYSVLHRFTGGDGSRPAGTLLLSGSTLYGMTEYGGSAADGTIFKIGTDGTGFSVLHSFTGGASDGSHPSYGSLVQSGSALYGMTHDGGASDAGTIFQIDTDGTDFSVVHSFFAGYPGDGSSPVGSLFLSGSTLYGTTQYGGANGYGAIFSLVVPEPSTFVLAILGGAIALLRRRSVHR